MIEYASMPGTSYHLVATHLIFSPEDAVQHVLASRMCAPPVRQGRQIRVRPLDLKKQGRRFVAHS